ncbi:ATP-binding protein [Paenibacillus sp. GCM10012307]|uniref:histidine kinase n=1 Tax=Paenibacillus roseus TaxID=2798579 RepID=A0A934J1M2_9BACL|nr:histidine kinase [Paenibacillus roseus]
MVSNIEQEAWSAKSGIRVGDVIKELNGGPPADNNWLVWSGNIQTAQNIVVERDSKLLFFDFSDLSKQPLSFNLTIVPIMLFTLFYLFSTFIAYKKPDDKPAIYLILFFMAVALGFLAAGTGVRGDIFSYLFMKICILGVPVIFLQFLVEYFRTRNIQVLPFKTGYLLYILIATWLVFEWISRSEASIGFLIGSNFGVVILFSIEMLCVWFVLVRMFIKYRHTPHGSLLKYMIFGNVGAFAPFILLYIIPLALLGKQLVEAGVAASFFLVLPLIYMYLVASRQLLDIEFIIGRLRYYCLIAIIPTLLLVPLVGTLMQREPFHSIQWLQSFLVVYIGVILFLYLKELLDQKVRNRLIKGAHRYEQSLEGFSAKVANVMKVHELEQNLAEEALAVLPISSVSFLERDTKSNIITLKKSYGPISLQTIMPQIRYGTKHLNVGEYLRTVGGCCYVVGKSHSMQHLMWISDKDNRMDFNHDERIWLRTLITYVGFVYDNLQLIEGLVQDLDTRGNEKAPPWVLRLLFRLSEQERRKLASDLHDSALQDQLLWYRRLESLTNDNQELSEGTKAELMDIQEGLLDVIHQIRETCNELRPPFLKEMGVIGAVGDLCARAQLHANYTINFVHSEFQNMLDDEYVLTIYRITQELLRNSMKHSKATKVDVELFHDGEQIRYRYGDNGIGMEQERLQSSFQHMGLSGIRERVWGLEGDVEFQTALGEGLEVSIWLPLSQHGTVVNQAI